jgi:hypothetical protein
MNLNYSPATTLYYNSHYGGGSLKVTGPFNTLSNITIKGKVIPAQVVEAVGVARG